MTNSNSDQQLITALVESVSRHLEIRAALIREAASPTEMVRWLRPVISDPNLNGGAIPPIYYKIAEIELMLRSKNSKRISRFQH